MSSGQFESISEATPNAETKRLQRGLPSLMHEFLNHAGLGVPGSTSLD